MGSRKILILSTTISHLEPDSCCYISLRHEKARISSSALFASAGSWVTRREGSWFLLMNKTLDLGLTAQFLIKSRKRFIQQQVFRLSENCSLGFQVDCWYFSILCDSRSRIIVSKKYVE